MGRADEYTGGGAGRRVPSPGFKAFWDAYGRKFDRVAAEGVWRRMSQKDRRAAMDGIGRYREACMCSGVAMAYPTKYLSHRRWEDEPPVQESGSAASGRILAEDMEDW